jgi:hypothetical protein
VPLTKKVSTPPPLPPLHSASSPTSTLARLFAHEAPNLQPSTRNVQGPAVERAAAQAKIDQQLAEMKVRVCTSLLLDITVNPFCFAQARHDRDLADLAAGVYVFVFFTALLF